MNRSNGNSTSYCTFLHRQLPCATIVHSLHCVWRVLGPICIVVTAATLPILAECQERGAPWTERPKATSDTAIGQNRRVPSGCGGNRPLVRRSTQPYFSIRFSRISCHRAIFARNAAREDYVNRASH